MKIFFIFLCFFSCGCIPQAYKIHAEEGYNLISNVKRLLCCPSDGEFESLIKTRQCSACIECGKSLSWFILKECSNVELNSGLYKWGFSSRLTKDGLVEILKSKGTLISESELMFSNVYVSSDYIQGKMNGETAYGLSFEGTFCVKMDGAHLTIVRLTVMSRKCKEKDFLLYNDKRSCNSNDPMNVLNRYVKSNEVTITDSTVFHKLEDIAYSKIEEHFRSGKDFARGREMFPVHIEGPMFSEYNGLVRFATYWISCRTRMVIEFDDDNTVKTVNYYMYNDNDTLIPITQNDYWRKVEKIPMPIQKTQGCSGLKGCLEGLN